MQYTTTSGNSKKEAVIASINVFDEGFAQVDSCLLTGTNVRGGKNEEEWRRKWPTTKPGDILIGSRKFHQQYAFFISFLSNFVGVLHSYF